jgi:hypothetical protein
VGLASTGAPPALEVSTHRDMGGACWGLALELLLATDHTTGRPIERASKGEESRRWASGIERGQRCHPHNNRTGAVH